jgi:hypothetical protein
MKRWADIPFMGVSRPEGRNDEDPDQTLDRASQCEPRCAGRANHARIVWVLMRNESRGAETLECADRIASPVVRLAD